MPTTEPIKCPTCANEHAVSHCDDDGSRYITCDACGCIHENGQLYHKFSQPACLVLHDWFPDSQGINEWFPDSNGIINVSDLMDAIYGHGNEPMTDAKSEVIAVAIKLDGLGVDEFIVD
jgi:hypothetical protein